MIKILQEKLTSSKANPDQVKCKLYNANKILGNPKYQQFSEGEKQEKFDNKVSNLNSAIDFLNNYDEMSKYYL
jgi:hypothetical protein